MESIPGLRKGMIEMKIEIKPPDGWYLAITFDAEEMKQISETSAFKNLVKTLTDFGRIVLESKKRDD